MKYILPLIIAITLNSCNKSNSDCTNFQKLDDSRGACDQIINAATSITISSNFGVRNISSTSIPNHKVGLFGPVSGALNPNAISTQNSKYQITAEPEIANSMTALLSNSGAGPAAGPQYSFGILLNGVELDPVAAEPFPHEGFMSPDVNWEWNLEALNVQLGLDCNNAHVQPNGKYHYHGSPTLYLEKLAINSDEMTHIGYAADGFPIYYKYAYTDANDVNSPVIAMASSYKLKEGDRPGDGDTAPCGSYDGIYSNDYEYVENLGDLDEANGRIGITPEYPLGTYYYIITDEFPSIPRYFKGTPSVDFKIGN